MADLISSKSPESSLSHQLKNQQTLHRQIERPRIQVPASSTATSSPSPLSSLSPSSTLLPNQTSSHPAAPSLKYLQQLNNNHSSARAESGLTLPIPTSSSTSSSSPSSLPSPPFSASSPSSSCSTGPRIGGRVSTAISSLYQASALSCSDSSSPSFVPRSSSPSSRLYLSSVTTSQVQVQGSSSSTNRVDQGFAEDTLSSLSNLMANPQPQHQQQQTEQQKRTTLLETTQSIPPQSMTLATKSAPLDSSSSSSSPASSSFSSSSLMTPPSPSSSSSSTLLLSSSSPVAVPPSLTAAPCSSSTSIIAPEKISFAPVVCTSTIEKEEGRQQKRQQLFHTRLDDRKEMGKEEKEEEEVDMKEVDMKEVDVKEEKGNGDIKGENERRESDDSSDNNTTTAMLTRTTTTRTMTRTTTTITSSCDSTSTSASMPAATAIAEAEAIVATNAGQQVHTACVIPPVGRDNLRYGSLDAAAMNDESTLLSNLAPIDTKLRPMSSMEYAESWLLTTAPSDVVDSPMTGTAASSRRPSADATLETHVSSTFNHPRFRPSSIMVTDQGIAVAVAAAANASCNNGPRRSSDQESVHPLQFDPEPRLSFDGSRQTACPSSSSLPPPFLSSTSTGESWLSLPPPSPSSFFTDIASSSSLSYSNYNTPSSDLAQSAPALLSIQTSATQEGPPHKTIRKKTSLASKIRKVFIKPMSSSSGSSGSNNNSHGSSSGGGSFSSSKEHDVDVNNNHHHNYHHQTLEDIMSMSSRDGDYEAQGGLLRSSSVGGGNAGELCPPGSHLIEHRGSVSSSSSGESMSVGQGGFSPSTPSTSPEMSPSGSPKPKHAFAPLTTRPSTAIAGGSIPDGHPLSPVEINHSINLAELPAASCGPKQPLEKRMSLEPTSTRTSKKRLSFASITSFFNPRNADAMAASNKKKQQRSSSVPNVESPLVVVAGGVGGVVGRPGTSGFQRRHSLNDLETGPQMQARFAAPPWDKDRVSAQAAAAAAEASENETSSSAGATTMSKFQGVFGKQSKKNKNKKNASHSTDNVPTATTASSAKPLRSALAHRPVRAPSVRKVQVVHRHQGSVSNTGRRLQQSEPLVNLSQEVGIHHSNGGGSRRSSEEHGRTGPTRHRRQSSIAGRQASQQGHYPAVDRKQRLSVRYSSSEEYDIVQHSDLYTPDQHQQQHQQQQQQQQQQQFQYHGGYIQYDNPAVPQTPRVNPVPTKSMSPQASDPFNHALANISPVTSRGACAEGSFTFSPVGSRRRDSYISCSSGSPSKDMSPKLTSASTPRQQIHAAVTAAVSNPHRRSSYDATTSSANRRSSYESNSRRNSMIVTSASPSFVAPVARLSVDHTLMSDHPGPASPSTYPQSTIAAMSPHGHHTIFANHQQQLHYQQQQQQQQVHRHHHQMQFLPEQQHHHLHQHQYHHNQQFMNPHAGSQVFHDQYHTSSPPQQQKQQQQYQQQQQQYQPYPYQYTMQQPMPSHLYYPSAQHPALSYTGVNMPHPPPPPALQYSSNGSGSKNGSNGPSPTSWSPVSPSPSPSTPPRPARQLYFSTAQPQIHETWTPDQYDRTSDPHITAHRLTPAIAQRIKLELNTFKSQEMLVHHESRVNTHFFA